MLCDRVKHLTSAHGMMSELALARPLNSAFWITMRAMKSAAWVN